MTDLTLSTHQLKLFIGKIAADRTTGCWNWTGATSSGYGRFALTRRISARAHRISYTNFVGPIPTGLVLDHLCRNRACVNPDHLEAVPNRINLLRGDGFVAAQAKRTHCPQGHAYDELNTYLDANNCRHCRECRRVRNRRYRLAAS